MLLTRMRGEFSREDPIIHRILAHEGSYLSDIKDLARERIAQAEYEDVERLGYVLSRMTEPVSKNAQVELYMNVRMLLVQAQSPEARKRILEMRDSLLSGLRSHGSEMVLDACIEDLKTEPELTRSVLTTYIQRALSANPSLRPRVESAVRDPGSPLFNEPRILEVLGLPSVGGAREVEGDRARGVWYFVLGGMAGAIVVGVIVVRRRRPALKMPGDRGESPHFHPRG